MNEMLYVSWDRNYECLATMCGFIPLALAMANPHKDTFDDKNNN